MKYLIIFIFFINFLYSSTLNLSITSNPSRLNPILSNDAASSSISSWLFDGLFKYDKNGEITNNLASSYYFETPKKLIIKLKDNVLWHDKVNFSSKDVVFTFEQIINPKVFNSIKSNFLEVESVKEIDSLTVEVNYKKPYFKALEIWMTGMLPYHLLKNEKDLMTSSFNKNPIGTGPYKLEYFKFGQDIKLISNKDYFEGKPKIDNIIYKFLPDSNTEFLYLKEHKLDIGTLEPIQIKRQIPKDFKEHYDIFQKQSFGYAYLGFNLNNEKFKDKRVRQALSLAINRQELIDILYFGYAQICNGPFLPDTFAYDNSVKKIKQNKNEAIRLLKEAGYNKNNPLIFEVITNTENDIRINSAQILQHQLKQIGVEMKIRVLEWQAFLNTVVLPKKFESILLAWSVPLMPDAYPIWHSSSNQTGGFNLVSYKNKKVDDLIEKGLLTLDKKELSKIYKEIFNIISDELPYLFLYIPFDTTAVNKKIKNVEQSFIGIFHNQKDWFIAN